MPPFKLEFPIQGHVYYRKPKLIFTKNLYSDGVKVERWQEVLEHKPIDADPYCQGKVNYFLSHYNRLGTYDDNSYRTTTGDMLEQVFVKKPINHDKLMSNYYTYNDNAECLTPYAENQCPTICATNYVTSMQHSYQMPHPYEMPRLSFPKIPFMQNRKYRHEEPSLSSDKFYGEDFQLLTSELHKHKGFRWTSYNPLTGKYTNVDGISTD